MTSEPRRGGYSISAVANLYEIHPQTLRLYEREGLLRPARTEGNTRVYTEENLKQLDTILNLTRQLGVNLAGVEIILNMREKMEQMQREISEFTNYVHHELAREQSSLADRVRNALVRLPRRELAPAVGPGSAPGPGPRSGSAPGRPSDPSSGGPSGSAGRPSGSERR